MIPALHADYSGDGWNRGTNDLYEFAYICTGLEKNPNGIFFLSYGAAGAKK